MLYKDKDGYLPNTSKSYQLQFQLRLYVYSRKCQLYFRLKENSRLLSSMVSTNERVIVTITLSI